MASSAQGKDIAANERGATSASSLLPSSNMATFGKIVPANLHSVGPIDKIENPNLRGLVIRQETQKAEYVSCFDTIC